MQEIESEKYGKDGAFEDPVVRCESCHKLVRVEVLCQRGRCACGATRVRNVESMTEEEAGQLREEWHIDPAFLALFEPDGLPDA